MKFRLFHGENLIFVLILEGKRMKEWTIRLFFLVILIYINVGCKQNDIYKNELFIAESYMEHHPDSALALLNQIESPEKLPPEQYALYCLLLTEAGDKTYVTHQSDSLITNATRFYEKQKDASKKAKALFYSGRVSQDMLQSEKAMNFFLTAIPYAEESFQYRLLALIYNNTAALYRQQKMHNEALNSAFKALEYCTLVNDTSDIIYSIRDVGRVYLFSNKVDSAFHYYEQALSLANRIGNIGLKVSIFNDLSVAYEHVKDYSNALKMVYQAIELTEDEHQDNNYLSLGSLYLEINELDSANYYLSKALNSPDHYVQAGANYYLYNLTKQLRSFDKALAYFEDYQRQKLQSRQSEQKEEILRLTHKYEQRELKKELELRTVRQRFIFSCCILFLLIIIAIVFFIYMKYRWSRERLLRLQEKQIQYEKELRLISEEQIRQNKEQIEFNRQKLINKEAVLQNVQRDLLQYNNKLLKAENELISLRREEHDFRNRLFDQTGLSERIRYAGVDIRKKDIKGRPFTAKNFPELVETLNEIYNDFGTRLQKKYPQLKDRDLEICYLLKAGAKTGNIAEIISMTPNAVTKKKRLILDKMEMIDKDASLEEFLEAF